jgi:hypothetical protein
MWHNRGTENHEFSELIFKKFPSCFKRFAMGQSDLDRSE